MAVLLSGCTGHDDPIDDAALPAVADPDRITVQDSLSGPVGINDITNKEQIAKFAAFISALPPQWTVPWYGSPIGHVYFIFYKNGNRVDNFYVGPDFFGRNVYYTDGKYDFFSQPATKAQIQELGQIVGFDLWKYCRKLQ